MILCLGYKDLLVHKHHHLHLLQVLGYDHFDQLIFLVR